MPSCERCERLSITTRKKFSYQRVQKYRERKREISIWSFGLDVHNVHTKAPISPQISQLSRVNVGVNVCERQTNVHTGDGGTE